MSTREYSNRMTFRLAAGAAFLLHIAAAAFLFGDETGRAGAAGAYMRMGVGARALGMGGGSVAVVNGGVTACYNPANLSFLTGHWLNGSLHTMSLDRRITYLGYAQPLKGDRPGKLSGGFSVGWLSAGVGDIDGRDFSGTHTGMMTASEHAYFFSFAFNPFRPVSIGVNTKLLNYRLPDVYGDGSLLSAVGFGFDIGISVRPLETVALGVTVRDIRSGYTWDTENVYDLRTQTRNDFPVVIRAGAAWSLLGGRVLAAGDIEKVDLYPWRFLGGVEAGPFQGAFIRAGYRYGTLTLGAGYERAIDDFMMRLDYAFAAEAVAPGASHLISWSLSF
ncbi:hypothetical protein JXO52_14485 [bacterium]|nr:hypothetical protein [bacterium]